MPPACLSCGCELGSSSKMCKCFCHRLVKRAWRKETVEEQLEDFQAWNEEQLRKRRLKIQKFEVIK